MCTAVYEEDSLRDLYLQQWCKRENCTELEGHGDPMNKKIPLLHSIACTRVLHVKINDKITRYASLQIAQFHFSNMYYNEYSEALVLTHLQVPPGERPLH